MKPGKQLFSILLVIFVVIAFAKGNGSAEDTRVSGEVKAGYRVLKIDPVAKDTRFVVYRGDYIKFQYPPRFGELTFEMAALQYAGVLQPDPDNSPFYKMKKLGKYDFSLGAGGGSIEVISLIRPNYVELTAEEAAELLGNRKLFILDVRTQPEYKRLHLEKSHLIPIQELQRRIGELEAQKHEDIFVYCATGNRSTVAAKIMADSGFKRIYNLRYGIHDWARRGYPYKTAK